MSLEINREGRVLRLTLNRPEKRNALSIALCHKLVDAFDEAEGDSTIGAILLDAKGPVFCAGMDLEEVLAPEAAARTAIHEKIFTLGSRIAKPIVAAIQGPALGGGVGLVANAHVVVAAQGCSFGLTELRIAMWPFVIFRAVANAIGERRATELSLTTRIFSAPEALQYGLVTELAPAFELDDRASAIAAQLSESSSEAIATGLAFVRRARELDSDAAGALAREMRGQAFASADFREGVTAFHEKRKPVWPSLKH
jgi:enoyl-CoA hydratase/carnithine racemase